MSKNNTPEMLDVGAENVDRTGFFCFMSKKKSEGYQRKLRWLEERFAEGMRIKMLTLPERGFIEYIPGEHPWRAVHADGYLLVHCLWVVGKSKGKGLSSALLDACVADARKQRTKGVAMATSEKVWMAGRRVLDKHGFECVDTAPPAFSLMVKKLGKHPSPSFAGGWDDKAKAFGKGLTVIRSDQCPYIADAANWITDPDYDWAAEWPDFNGRQGQTVIAEGLVTYHTDIEGDVYRELELSLLWTRTM